MSAGEAFSSGEIASATAAGDTAEVVIVGGGIIGLSIAWRCRQRGLAVTVHDGGSDDAAWYAAAGMLAPAGEAGFGQEALTRLLVESAARWPEFAAGLERET